MADETRPLEPGSSPYGSQPGQQESPYQQPGSPDQQPDSPYAHTAEPDAPSPAADPAPRAEAAAAHSASPEAGTAAAPPVPPVATAVSSPVPPADSTVGQSAGQPAGQPASPVQPSGSPSFDAPPVQTSQPPLPFATPVPQGTYTPAQKSTSSKWFPLALVGLILSIVGLCIPGIILCIVGLVKWSKERTENGGVALDSKTQIVSIIGIVMAIIGLIAQAFFVWLVADIARNPGNYDVGYSYSTSISSGGLDQYRDQLDSSSTGSTPSDSASRPALPPNAAATDAFADTDDDMRFVAPGSKSALADADAQWVGEPGFGMMQVPADWVDYHNLDNPSDTTVAKADPSKTYESPAYGGTEYANIIMMEYYQGTRDELYQLYFDGRYQDPELSNIKAKHVEVNGSPAILMVSDFEKDRKTLYEYFIDPVNADVVGTCCYVYFECPTEEAATITSYINSFKVS